MGQQQLLLVVLSVIVVGLAVVMGINMFNQGADAANIDAVVNDVVNMGARAQQYFVKPVAMGGGGRDFTGLDIGDVGVADNENGSYVVTSVAADSVVITGTCDIAQTEAGEFVTVVATVTETDISTVVNN